MLKLVDSKSIFQLNKTEKLFLPFKSSICMPKTGNAALPKIVRVYRQRYCTMAESKYLRDLRNYARASLQDPIEDLDWKQLLNWSHRHFEYTRGELPKRRAELPIDIIKQAKGRCGEFALLYNGLLLANGYECRIVIDCSTIHDISKTTAGDHVWNEVFVDHSWLHVDPTERRINEPLMYAEDWNKDVNLVYAISRKDIMRVTETYIQPESRQRCISATERP